MTNKVAIVIVSHSPLVAEGTADMVRQMVGEEVRVAHAGGNPEGGLGTDVAKILAAIESVWSPAGVAVLVISAVGRTKDSKGRSSYDGDSLSLASFRESSELEFGADDAFILVSDGADADTVTLRHLKARHSEAKDLQLQFERSLQRFAPIAGGGPAPGERGKLQSALRSLWERTRTAPENGEGGES